MRALLVAALLVAGSLAAGCGSDDGGLGAANSESASTKDFCQAYNSLFDAFSAGEAPSDEESVKALKDWAAELEGTGTPTDVPEGARRGFEVILETVDKIDDDATQDELKDLTDGLSTSDQDDAAAFGEYATKTCPLEMPGTP
jgi:hypothetical protein